MGRIRRRALRHADHRAQPTASAENIVGKFAVGDLVLDVRTGLPRASSNKSAERKLVPEGWNNFAESPARHELRCITSHLGLGLTAGLPLSGLHYVFGLEAKTDRATTGAPAGRQDQRARRPNLAALDGSLRLLLRPARPATSPSRERTHATVGNSIQINNAEGGPGLMLNYLGPNSNGHGASF